MYIGIDIGGTKCAAVLADSAGKILKKTAFPTESCESTLQKLLNLAADYQQEGEIASVGISCGGPLNEATGEILSPPNLPGWDKVPVCQMFRERLGVPAYICNDADACALAEWMHGAGKGTQHMAFLTFGTGLGAGLVLNGRRYRGACGNAGEVGHIRLSEYGPVGYGKIGSFEGFCSGGGLAQIGKSLALSKIQVGSPAPFAPTRADCEQITAKLLAEYADRGDETAKEAYRLCGEMLGRGLAMMIDLLNPECIVIGSVFARSEHLLRQSMEEVLHREILPTSWCPIRPAVLGEQLGDMAAVTVAMLGLRGEL